MFVHNRRDFLVGAVSSVLLGAGSATLPAFAAESAEYDVAIVGAGIAGMSAAQVLKRAGKNVIILEAAGHVGGRCVSDNTTFPGVVWDRGAQWFHQVLSYNPLYRVARSEGRNPVEDSAPRQVWKGAGYDSAATANIDSLYDEVNRVLERVGEEVNIGGSDVSAAAAVRNSNIATKPLLELVEAMIGPLTAGSEFDSASAYDLGNFTEALSGDDYLLQTGMGNFIAQFANGLEISLNTPVTSITYGSRSGVSLKTASGTITAKRVIVTVSTGVLSAEAIAFAPALPAAYQKAIDDLPMGTFEKIALGFDSDVFGPIVPNTNIFQEVDNQETPGLIAKLWGHNVAIVYLGGRHAVEIVNGGIPAEEAFALSVVQQSFPKAKRFSASATTPWHKNPWTRGSYSYAKPGGVPSRRVLAAPLGGDQLYFAGEALSIHSYGTLSAAYQSGVATAKAILGVPSIVS
jgi:monoamine oxidase